MPPSKNTLRTQAPRWRTALKIAGIAFFVLFFSSAGAALALLSKFNGTSIGKTIIDLPKTVTTFVDPRQSFPGQSRITVLCLGLDRNVYHNKRDRAHTGMFYTKGARSDVMMVASLDLENRTASVLSIPRDTRVKIPGHRYYSKINQAHSDGGVPLTEETVKDFLGVDVDHYVVIKQEAIQQLVDALGGLNLNVEGALIDGKRVDMDYDDNWGQLHVHLKPGMQRLDGQQVVGYMRFRHDAEGDFGRIRRQQQVIQALTDEAKSPSVLLKAGKLIDAIRRNVDTDLTSEQQLALAHLFGKMQRGNVTTVQLPVADTPTIDGVSYVVADDSKKEAVVDWVIHGNQEAMNRLIRVELRNASGHPELYQQVYRVLRNSGFEVWRAGRVPDQLASSKVVQRTNLNGSGRRLLDVLGLRGSVEKSDESGPDVTFYVGKDLEGSQVLATADPGPDANLTDARAEPPRYAYDDEQPRRPRRRRSSRRSERSGARVHIRRAEPAVADSGDSGDSGAESSEPSAPSDSGGDSTPPPPADSPGTDQ